MTVGSILFDKGEIKPDAKLAFTSIILEKRPILSDFVRFIRSLRQEKTIADRIDGKKEKPRHGHAAALWIYK
jgi:hypothetical protein